MPGSSRTLRILLDEQLPTALRKLLAEHDARTVHFMGWKGLQNGELITAAERVGFDVFLTADRNLRYQQGIVGRGIAVVVLSTNRMGLIKASLDAIKAALADASPGSLTELACFEAPVGRPAVESSED